MHTVCAVQQAGRERDWRESIETLRQAPLFWGLDSAQESPRLGRYSFAGADPYLVVRGFGDRTEVEVRRAARPDLERGRSVLHDDPLDVLEGLFPPPPREDPGFPFLGGAVGYFGYELAAGFQPVRFRALDDLGLPDLCWLFVDRLLAFDHLEGRIRSIGLGFAADPDQARVRAEQAAALHRGARAPASTRRATARRSFARRSTSRPAMSTRSASPVAASAPLPATLGASISACARSIPLPSLLSSPSAR
jgi:anthranilate/para-aminobenzoate synthase component I